MSEGRPSKAPIISTMVVVVLACAAGVASLLLYLLGNWEEYAWALTLTLRIIWGCWLVTFLATLLTRVTIFGWTFRRYFPRPPEAPTPPGGVVPRPTQAPWPKSGAASFSITVVMASLTGGAAIAVAVMWILKDVTGEWVYWLVTRIIAAAWWVLMVATVLTRVSLFGLQKKKAVFKEQPAATGTPTKVATPSDEI
jgi:hypothetical protein